MKHYIFITNDLHVIGGTEMYVAGKADYLRRHGWQVRIFYKSYTSGPAKIPLLNPYLDGMMQELAHRPYVLSDEMRHHVLAHMCRMVGSARGDRVIVESHYDCGALWGELLAERLQGRHIFMACDELFRRVRGGKKIIFYEENLPLFYFKWKRGELLISHDWRERFFQGYKDTKDAPAVAVERFCETTWVVREMDPVQDVEDDRLQRLTKHDFTICHVGRMEKEYVPYALRGVRQFAQKHPDKTVQMVLVGNTEQRREEVRQVFSSCGNVTVVDLGIMAPIPRALVTQCDVVLAISQTARFLANEGVKTIVARLRPERSGGVLGYDTEDPFGGDDVSSISYADVLERVLAERAYDSRTYHMPLIPSADECYEASLQAFDLMTPELVYDTEHLDKDRRADWMALFPYAKVPAGARIVIYGAGKVGQEYWTQIMQQGYCTVLYFADTHAEEYDDSVRSREALLQDDGYDFIVIAVANPSAARAIKGSLMAGGVPSEKIVDDFLRYEPMIHQK